jgi:hypothetical protein
MHQSLWPAERLRALQLVVTEILSRFVFLFLALRSK